MIYMGRLNIFHQDFVFMYYFSLSTVYIWIFVRKAINSIELSVNTISIHYIKSSNISVVYTVYCIIS